MTETCLHPELAPSTGYKRGCRCARCGGDHLARERAARAKKAPASPPRPRPGLSFLPSASITPRPKKKAAPRSTVFVSPAKVKARKSGVPDPDWTKGMITKQAADLTEAEAIKYGVLDAWERRRAA
jgi:hypothetical protein